MASDIFMADYSNCRDTNREVQSNLTYIEEVISKLKKMDTCIYDANIPSDVWNTSNYASYFTSINQYLSKETDRYTNFHTTFDTFHNSLETTDSALKAILDNSINLIEENEKYDSYLSVIKMDEKEELKSSIYDELILQGVSKEDALKISSLAEEGTKEKLEELSELSPSALESTINEIQSKVEKSPYELVLLDLLALNAPSTYADLVKEFSSKFATGGLAGILEKGYLGKSVGNYNLDINSLSGQINKLERAIVNGHLSQARINGKTGIMQNLKVVRDTKISNVTKVNSTKNNLANISKWLGRAVIAYNVVIIGADEWAEHYENGAELDDVIADGVIEGGGILASVTGGALATSAALGMLGTGVAPVVGTTVGIAAGFVGGAAVGFVYGLTKPVLTESYNDVIEPLGEGIVDKTNDIGDWWDKLWW